MQTHHKPIKAGHYGLVYFRHQWRVAMVLRIKRANVDLQVAGSLKSITVMKHRFSPC